MFKFLGNFFTKYIVVIFAIILFAIGFTEDLDDYNRLFFSQIDDHLIDQKFPRLPEKESRESLATVMGEDKNKNKIRDDVERNFAAIFYKKDLLKKYGSRNKIPDKYFKMYDISKEGYVYNFNVKYTERVKAFLKNAYEFSKLEKTYEYLDLSNKDKKMQKKFLVERQKLKNEATCIYKDFLSSELDNKIERTNFQRLMYNMLNTEKRRDHFGRYLFFKKMPFIKLFKKYKDYEFYGFHKWSDELSALRKKECNYER